jgi:hypothetical protein
LPEAVVVEMFLLEPVVELEDTGHQYPENLLEQTLQLKRL